MLFNYPHPSLSLTGRGLFAVFKYLKYCITCIFILILCCSCAIKEQNSTKQTNNVNLKKLSSHVLYKAFKYRTGCAVVMDVNSGKILGMFNPKMAVESIFPPGSTAKLVTAFAALKEGITDSDRRIVCDGNYFFDNHLIHCWVKKGHGNKNLKEAIALSCNIHFYKLATELGRENLSKYYKYFGFTTKTGINLPDEKAGYILPSDSLEDTLNLAVGEKIVSVTPLQIANFISCIANGGTLYKPFIGDNSRGGILKNLNLNSHDKEYLDYIKLAMALAVSEGNARNASLNHIIIAGKTGSATIAGTKQTHGWFAGFAPYDDPKVAVVVFIKEGKGFTTSASIAKEIFNSLF